RSGPTSRRARRRRSGARSKAGSRVLQAVLGAVVRARAEPRDQRHLVTGEPEEEALAVHLDQRQEALGAEVAARDEPDARRTGVAAAPEQSPQESDHLLSPARRSDGLITSVSRTPNLSFTITASPRAIGFPLTSRSSGSPASLPSSITEPAPSWRSARSGRRVRPISTVTSSGMSSSSSKFRGVSAVSKSAMPSVPLQIRPVTRTALLPPAT